jgi:hypothetical protein
MKSPHFKTWQWIHLKQNNYCVGWSRQLHPACGLLCVTSLRAHRSSPKLIHTLIPQLVCPHTHSSIHSPTHSFTHSFTHLLIHLFTYSFIHIFIIYILNHSHTHSHTHSHIHSFIHSLFIHSSIHSFIHPLIHSFAHILIHLFANSLIHSILIHLYIHSFTYSIIRILIHSLIYHSFTTHSFVHLLIHSHIHSFTAHSFIHSPLPNTPPQKWDIVVLDTDQFHWLSWDTLRSPVLKRDAISWKVRETLTTSIGAGSPLLEKYFCRLSPQQSSEVSSNVPKGRQEGGCGKDPVRASSGDVTGTGGRLTVQTFKPGSCQAASSSGYPSSSG